MESQDIPADSVRVQTAAVSTSSSGLLGPGSELTKGRPAIAAHSVPGPS